MKYPYEVLREVWRIMSRAEDGSVMSSEHLDTLWLPADEKGNHIALGDDLITATPSHHTSSFIRKRKDWKS
jgi:hypothetical protein